MATELSIKRRNWRHRKAPMVMAQLIRRFPLSMQPTNPQLKAMANQLLRKMSATEVA